nr:uncharacterized protein LOC112717439 [Arachis hypogaea]
MIVEVIKPLVEVDSSLKVKSVIAEAQLKFNYTIMYHKAWLAKQKAIAKKFGGWKASYETLSSWFKTMVQKDLSAAVEIETTPTYQGDEVLQGCIYYDEDDKSDSGSDGGSRCVLLYIMLPNKIKYLCMFISMCCCVFVSLSIADGTHLYGKYKGVLLVVVSQDGNDNIVPLAFAVVEGYCRIVREFIVQYARLCKHDEAYTQWLDRIP